MEAVELVFAVFAFAVGALIGSFANVCIHRLPKGLSVVSPRSTCPRCGQPIAFYDNVPILSWLLLRGRCRSCRAPISRRYPLIEAAVATLFLLADLAYGPSLVAAAAAVLAAASVILIATDLEARVLPDEVTIVTLGLGLLLAGARDAVERPVGASFAFWDSHLLDALLGAAAGAAVLLLVRAGYQAVRGVEGMGLGDVKMIAMIGALTGLWGVFLTLLLSSAAGALIGAGLILVRWLRWARARAAIASGAASARDVASRCGLLVDAGGRVVAADAAWSEIPGAAAPGERALSSYGASRPLLAVLRLARRRAAAGKRTECGRVMLDDGAEFFRVLAVRAESVAGELLVFLGRADIPFGVFLAVGSLAAFAFGRVALRLLAGELPIPGVRLLP